MPQPIQLWGANVPIPAKTNSIAIFIAQWPFLCSPDFNHLTAAIAALSEETAS